MVELGELGVSNLVCKREELLYDGPPLARGDLSPSAIRDLPKNIVLLGEQAVEIPSQADKLFRISYTLDAPAAETR